MAESQNGPVSALRRGVAKSPLKGPTSSPFAGPGINAPGCRPTAEFRDGPALALFFVGPLGEGLFDRGRTSDPQANTG
jgi:hypothetical protein